MRPPERYRFVHDHPIWQSADGPQTAEILTRMYAIAREQNDHRSGLALRYYLCKSVVKPNFSLPNGQTNASLLAEMERDARTYGFPVEETVAHYHLANERHRLNTLPFEAHYVEVMNTFNRMESIGFEEFADYDPGSLLFSIGQFMWDLDPHLNNSEILLKNTKIKYLKS